MKVAALALLVLFACASEPIDPLPEPARRLRRQYVTAEGGARQLLHLLDTVTGEPCDFRASEDLGAPGACVPSAWGSTVFLDDACARPMVHTYGASHAWVAVLSPVPGPDRLEKLVRLGALAVEPPAAWQQGPEGCVQGSASGGPVYGILEELPRAGIAVGELAERPLTDGLVAQEFVGDDGSRFIRSLVDRTSGAVCKPGLSAAGPRCVPMQETIAHGGLYDGRCERVAYANFLGGPVAAVTELGGATFRFGARISGTTVTVGRRGPRGACVTEQRSIAADGALHFGVPYPPSEWPALTLGAEGLGRLTASVATLPDGVRHFEQPATFDDRGRACTPMWVDGVLRCLALPIYPGWAAYSDPACKQALAAFSAEDGPSPAVTVIEAPGAAARGNLLPLGRVRAIGREVTEVYVVTRSIEGCSRARAEGWRYFEFGADVPAEGFAELKLITE